jgi:hypothetical protein
MQLTLCIPKIQAETRWLYLDDPYSSLPELLARVFDPVLNSPKTCLLRARSVKSGLPLRDLYLRNYFYAARKYR